MGGRLKHLSHRTEQTYLPVIRRFIELHGGRAHPRDMGAPEIRAYLSHLAVASSLPAPASSPIAGALPTKLPVGEIRDYHVPRSYRDGLGLASRPVARHLRPVS